MSQATQLERDYSNHCGVTLIDSTEGRTIATMFRAKPNVKITTYPALIRIDAEHMLEFDMREISETLGYEMTPYLFQVELSTHYGRLVLLDDKVLLFANAEDAAPYLGITRD